MLCVDRHMPGIFLQRHSPRGMFRAICENCALSKGRDFKHAKQHFTGLVILGANQEMVHFVRRDGRTAACAEDSFPYH